MAPGLAIGDGIPEDRRDHAGAVWQVWLVWLLLPSSVTKAPGKLRLSRSNFLAFFFYKHHGDSHFNLRVSIGFFFHYQTANV